MTASRTLGSRPLLSPQACLVSCFQQLMVETCSCGYYLHPLPSGAEYCSYARHPAWGETPHPLPLRVERGPALSACKALQHPGSTLVGSSVNRPSHRSLLLPAPQGPGDSPASLFLPLPQALQVSGKCGGSGSRVTARVPQQERNGGLSFLESLPTSSLPGPPGGLPPSQL